MLNEGTYVARGVSAALGYTSKGSEQVAVQFKLNETGEKIAWYGYFSEKTFDRTIETLRLCGWAGNDLDDLSGIDANEVEIVVEHENDLNNEPRARVRWVNKVGGAALKEQLKPNEARSFAAKMKGLILAADQKAGRKTAVAQRAAASPARASLDDEIPF